MSPFEQIVRIPEGASSGQIRVLGLKAAGLGLVLFLPGLAFFFLVKDWAFATFGTQVGDKVYLPRPVVLVIGGPMAGGYALLMIGLSRVFFGAASQSRSAIASIGRILFGVVATIGMVAVALVLFVAFAGR